jgi:CheY-like chemotaxis protein
LKMLQILLIEDNPADVVLIRQALEEYGIQHCLHVVEDGAEALAYVTRMGAEPDPACPDLLLLDLNMPKADGLDVLRRLRSAEECRDTRVIVVTSSSDPKDRQAVEQLAVDAFFHKPSDLDAFMRIGELIKQLMTESRNRETP